MSAIAARIYLQRRGVARRHRAVPALTVLLVLVSLAAAPAAWAHAQLLGSSPESGATLTREPAEVIFRFNQDVGGTFGAIRVYDAQGAQVDDLAVSHPGGNERWLGVGLKPGLADGTYTATYRVISADTHVVYGGLVFALGHRGAMPRYTVAGLIDRDRSGHVTAIAFGVVRALDYLTLALMLGGLVFVLFVWRRAFTAVAGEEPRWEQAGQAFGKRARGLFAGTVALGVVVAVLGVLLQGATAAGVSLWSSLRSPIIEATLESRFGTVWGLRAIDWLLIGALLWIASRSPARWVLALLALGAAYLAITPALAGHASVESPVAVFFPTDVLHVLAASVWVGGIAFLLLALPQATRRLEGAERTRLLLATLARFSPLALAAVIVIAASGVVQAYIDVRTIDALLHTTYGALIIVKMALLIGLIGLGWVNRARVIPALGRLVAERRPPSAGGVLARRTMRGELALMICVFAATAALISYAPPIDAASGPFSIDTTIGAAELEMTVEPARVGANTIHLYLINARDGTPFQATKELTATATLPGKGIGPLPLKANVAGPGHYALDSVELTPGGTWQIQITDRVSEFEEHTSTISLPIR